MRPNQVAFSTWEYEKEHGRKPRGEGSWAFCPRAHYKRADYLRFVFWVHGAKTFGAAKKTAAAHFAAAGCTYVEVCS